MNDRKKPQREAAEPISCFRSEIDAWREKKASEEANARYNEMLYYGLADGDDKEELDE